MCIRREHISDEAVHKPRTAAVLLLRILLYFVRLLSKLVRTRRVRIGAYYYNNTRVFRRTVHAKEALD